MPCSSEVSVGAPLVASLMSQCCSCSHPPQVSLHFTKAQGQRMGVGSLGARTAGQDEVSQWSRLEVGQAVGPQTGRRQWEITSKQTPGHGKIAGVGD